MIKGVLQKVTSNIVNTDLNNLNINVSWIPQILTFIFFHFCRWRFAWFGTIYLHNLYRSKFQIPKRRLLNSLLQTKSPSPSILPKSTVSLLFENHLLAKVTYLLIRFNKTKSFLWNKKNTDRNHVNEQKTHKHFHTLTPYTTRKMALERISVLCVQWPTLLLKIFLFVFLFRR